MSEQLKKLQPDDLQSMHVEYQGRSAFLGHKKELTAISLLVKYR